VVAECSRSSCGVLAATIVVIRAPKGQLLLAQGIALGLRMERETAPCKGSYITQSRGYILPFFHFCLRISVLQSFNISVLATQKTGCNETVATCSHSNMGKSIQFFHISIFQFSLGLRYLITTFLPSWTYIPFCCGRSCNRKPPIVYQPVGASAATEDSTRVGSPGFSGL
jgi:hypothetical protein